VHLIARGFDSDREFVVVVVDPTAMEEETGAPAAAATLASVPDGAQRTPSDSAPRLRLEYQDALMHGESPPLHPRCRVLATVAPHCQLSAYICHGVTASLSYNRETSKQF
jgi:hypothetical protein